MIKWIPILTIILLLPIVMADEGEIETYKPREVMDLSIHLTNKTGNVAGAVCQIEVRNESYGVIFNTTLNEIGGGWYNGTYNQSRVGKYFCRQNCTMGKSFTAGTCDFIIGVEDNMIFGMLIAIPLFIALFLLVISWMLDPEKYWAMKFGMVMLGFIFIFQSYQYSHIVINEFFTSTNLTNAIGDSTRILGYVFGFIMLVFGITFIYDIFMMFDKKKHKTGEYDDD